MVAPLSLCAKDILLEHTGEYFSDKQVMSLARAGASGDSDMVAKLVSDGVDVNARGTDGMTPVIWALLALNERGFECLLQHGANPNLQLTGETSPMATEIPFPGNSSVSLAAMYDDIGYRLQLTQEWISTEDFDRVKLRAENRGVLHHVTARIDEGVRSVSRNVLDERPCKGEALPSY